MDNTMRRQYGMPFGAHLCDDGRVRFRLWAPAARCVELCLLPASGKGEIRRLPLAMEAEGWFGLTTALASAGSRYRFLIDGDHQVPDPASRYQPDDVHGASEVIAANRWQWHDNQWLGRPWYEAVIYELHVGSFTPEGTFAAAAQKLDYLVELGITAVELMPLADFPGDHSWGYDGAYLFAPDSRYGRPDTLKAFIEAAHARNLMVFLDIVYNHFGPEGNYLHIYAPQFFSERHHTPWGAAINFDGDDSHWVRQFFIHNALFWLDEYHFDGLRLDAVHAITDDSSPDILVELADQVRRRFNQTRHIHLLLENDNNASRYLKRDSDGQPRLYTAQWNDDLHHSLHVLLTHETDGYYLDFADAPLRHLGRSLSEGFAYQGEASPYRDHRRRGETSKQLPATAFIAFLQNHDQVGNRAFGERLLSLTGAEQFHAALAILLLIPSPPLLFMGQEWGSLQPFPYFCDVGADFVDAVINGRRQEFARFPQFQNPQAWFRLPNPVNSATFAQAILDWNESLRPQHQHWLGLHRQLLAIRRQQLIPRLADITHANRVDYLKDTALSVRWRLNDGMQLLLITNLGNHNVNDIALPHRPPLYSTHPQAPISAGQQQLPPWSTYWYLYNATEDAA